MCIPIPGLSERRKCLIIKKVSGISQFIDVCSENELVYALDRQWQRVYVFDSLGNRLATMGTVGEQLGSFRGVAAVEVLDGRVFVLDGNKGNVTTFVPTAYGTQILTAVSLYNQGHYLEAIEPWKQVLAMSANNELAYSGIGEAYLKMGDYAQALEYFRLGGNRERESVAFEQYRAQTLRRWILPLLLVFFTLIVVAIVFTNNTFSPICKDILTQKNQENGETVSVMLFILFAIR